MSGIVPVKIASAAEMIIAYIETIDDESRNAELVVEFLQQLVDAPHTTAIVDPLVFVSWDYSGYRNGDYSTQARIPLSHYIWSCTLGCKFYFSDVLGKHSELKCNASDFDVRFSLCSDDEEEVEHDCSDQWAEGVEGDGNLCGQLEDFIDQRISSRGPLSGEEDLSEIIAEEMEAASERWSELESSVTYPVHICLKEAIEIAQRDTWTRQVPDRGFKSELRLCFRDPYEAAHFIVTSPTVKIKKGSVTFGCPYPVVRDHVIIPSKFEMKVTPEEKDTTCAFHSPAHQEYTIEWANDKEVAIASLKEELENAIRPSWEECLEAARRQKKKARV